MFAITQTEYYLTLLKYIGLRYWRIHRRRGVLRGHLWRSFSTPITGDDPCTW